MGYSGASSRPAILICAFIMLSGMLVPIGATPYNDEAPVGSAWADNPISTGIGYDHYLRFNDLEFDPAEGVLLPPNLRSITDYFIVQFDGPINRGWKEDLKGLGVEFFWYLPNFAFIIRMPGGGMDQVRSHVHVRAVYPYHTAFKVPKELWGTNFDPSLIEVRAVPLEDGPGIAAQVEARGGKVHGVSEHEVLFTLRGDMLLEIARLPQTGWVEPFREPTVMNDNYARTIKVRQQADGAFNNDGASLWSFNSGNFPGITAGEDIIVAVYDTGMDTTHPAFQNTPGDANKLVWFKDYTDGSENDWHDSGSHGTHTSCTVLGNGKWRASDPGTDGRYTGMAPRARLIGQMGLTVSAGTVYTHLNDPLSHGANHTSNSWGDPGSHKSYTGLSSNYDKYTRDANTSKAGDQELLSVFAAGNEGNSGPREPAVAKNVLTVGATGNDKGSSSSTVVGFSAKGPTDDGRMKPDIVTPGDGVWSCSTGSTSYRTASGTSMACPGAAGGVAVVRSYFNNTHGFTPSPALTKALVINGATPLPGYTYPGNTQGWGRMDIANSVLENATKKIWYMEQDPQFALETGFSVSIPVQVNSQRPLRATLAWTDVEGATDNPKPALVNDLNLKAITPTDQSYWGNRFNNGESVTGGNADTINNVEGLYLSSSTAGQWTFRVEGFNIADGPQDFSLVIAGDVTVGNPVLEAEDLIPTNMTVEPSGTVIEGDTIRIKADINNEGTRKTQVVKYQWWIDNELQDIITFEGEVPSKGKVGIEYDWLTTRGNHEIRLVLDPYNTHFEQNESNNWIMTHVFVDNFGIEFKSLDGTSQKVDPGGSVTYRLQVKNTGTINDTYHFEHDDAPVNWSVELDTETIDVPPGEVGTVGFTVTAPDRALVSEFARVQVRSSSAGNTTYKGQLNLMTTINQIAALRLEMDVNSSMIAPSGKVRYDFTLFNDGNGQDTVTLTVNGTPFGWFVGLSDYIAVLEPYSSKDLNCIVTAPINAKAGFKAAANIEGFSTSGIKTVFGIEATVEKVRGMNLSSEAEPVVLEPGDSADFKFRLRNDGNYEEIFSLSVDPPDGWDPNITAEDVVLGPFGQVDRVLTLHVPDDEFMGRYTVLLTAVNETGASLSLEFEVEVEQVFGLEAEMTPGYQNLTKGGLVHMNITVTNLGNGPDKFEFWLDSTTLVVYSSFSNYSLELLPGETGKVELTINTSMIGLGNHTVPVHVYSTVSQSSTSDLETMFEVLAPPKKKDKPDKPNPPPGPIDITPGGGDLRSGEGLLLIGLLLVILLVVAVLLVVGYNKYRAMKDARRQEELADRVLDGEKEEPPPRRHEPARREEPVSSFDLDSHLSSFATSTTDEGAGAAEEQEPIEAEVVEEEVKEEPPAQEPVAEPTVELDEPEEDEGLLPPTVVDDTISSQMSADTGEGPTTGHEEEGAVPDEGPQDDDRSDSEKDLEKKEKTLEEIMKELND